MNDTLKTILENRYTTKVFDPDWPADEQKIQTLIETLRLAPSSINSQPWHFFVISNPDERARLAESAWENNKPKFCDASHLFVFCAKTQFDENDVHAIEELTAGVRGMEIDEERLNMLTSFVSGKPSEERNQWLKQQVYLAFGQFLLSSAILDLDVCPMEGFSTEMLDELMGLKSRGLTSVVLGLVGNHAEGDFNHPSRAPKVRFPKEQVVTEIR
ncbi:nitroreductase family protein [Kistimonas asteriae]|uniref:nitroreductase family protein n=1 Tax=Kistimonas asteriae TaxID=517724 RepID=UPI001BA64A36|nr:nitroreductase family protein [Kistimonas asteriae]